MDKLAIVVLAVLGVFGILFLLSILHCLPVMLLWNWLMPLLFGLPKLTFWQAFGLTWLCSLLFKSHASSGSK